MDRSLEDCLLMSQSLLYDQSSAGVFTSFLSKSELRPQHSPSYDILNNINNLKGVTHISSSQIKLTNFANHLHRHVYRFLSV